MFVCCLLLCVPRKHGLPLPRPPSSPPLTVALLAAIRAAAFHRGRRRRYSPSLPQLAKTPLYPSLVAVALRCKRWSSGGETASQQRRHHHAQQQQQQQPFSVADAAVPPPPTSSAEFLLLAMACAGAHGRAAALACETSGIHPGLRTLDGGLAVLGRRLREEGGRRKRGVHGVAPEGSAGPGEAEMGWFRPWMERLRETALEVFEGDVLD